MKPDEAASCPDIPGGLTMPDVYRLLNARRIRIDQHIASLPSDDPGLETDWQALDSVLVELRRLVSRLAGSTADDLAALRGKADVLRTLFGHDEVDGGPNIPEDERSALAASLARDVLRLPDA